MTFGAFQGQLRPLVEAAWKGHAGLLGVSTTDRAEHEEFYRTHLWVAARIKSTKEADERQYGVLLTYFRNLAPGAAAPATAAPRANVEPSAGMRVNGITPAQAAAFWKLARRAHAVAQAREDTGSEAPFATWLTDRLQEAFKRPVLIDTGLLDFGSDGHTHGFDTAMGALAVIAFDRYWIERTAEGMERRLRWQLDRFLADLSWLEGKAVGWEYVLGIHRKAHHGLPATVDEATEPQLVEVLDMLDSHIRRLCKRWDLRPCMCPTRKPQGMTPKSLDLLTEWLFHHHPTPGHTRGPDGQLLHRSPSGGAAE